MGAIAIKLVVSLASSMMPGIAAGLGLTGFAATAFSYIASGLVSMLAGKVFGGKKKSAKSAAAAADEGFLVNGQGSIASIPVVYGRRRIAGSRAFIQTTDGSGNKDGNHKLQLVFSVAEGTIAQYEKVYFNDQLVWLNDDVNDANVHTGTVQNNKVDADDKENKDFTGKVEFNFFRGNQLASDAGLAPVISSIGSEWTNNHYGADLAWMHTELTYDRDVFSGLPTVQVEITGREIRDVNDLAAGTTNDKDECRNPANIIYDFLTNDTFGKAIPDAELNIESFQLAHAYYETRQMWMEGAIGTGTSILDNLDTLMLAGTSYLVYSQGQYHLRLNRTRTTPVADLFEFNEDNLIGGWKIMLGEKSSRLNAIKVIYADPEKDWNENIVYIKDSTYLAEDNATPLEQQVQLPFASTKELATRFARFLLNQSRYQTTVSFKSTHTALDVEVGDIVKITHGTTGWSEKLFRVMSISLTAEGEMDITCIEYEESVYDSLEDTNWTET